MKQGNSKYQPNKYDKPHKLNDRQQIHEIRRLQKDGQTRHRQRCKDNMWN
jgi:hypothetical protein